MEFEISLNNLSFYAYHGVYEEELKTGNEFRINLSVWIPCHEEMDEDDLENTVSYADLYSIVEAEMKKPRKLLETVALSIAKTIKKDFSLIKRGSISIEKVHPPIPGMLGSASVILNF